MVFVTFFAAGSKKEIILPLLAKVGRAGARNVPVNARDKRMRRVGQNPASAGDIR